MSRREIVIAFIFSLLLGVGVILAIKGSGGISLDRFFNNSESSESTPIEMPDAEPSLTLENASPTEAPTIGSRLPEPTLVALDQGPEKGADIEDVLLLYSAEHPLDFDINFCRIAEFLGLICKEIDLDSTTLTDEFLRDSNGDYFRLIGIAGENFLRKRVNSEERALIRSLLENNGINLVLSDISEYRDPAALVEFTKGAVTGYADAHDAQRIWFISSKAPEITKELTDQVITTPSTTPQIDLGLVVQDWSNVTSLISSVDEEGVPYHTFIKYSLGEGAFFIDAGEWGKSLDEVPFRDMFFTTHNFSKITPLLMTMKYVMGDEAWHRDQNYVNLTIDSLALSTDSRGMDYQALAENMEAYDFHTTIGFIPKYWKTSELDVVNVIRTNPERFSLVQVGNNADGYEFYKYSLSEEDDPDSLYYLARPLADQEADILESLVRLEGLKLRTGIQVDRIMIFPQNISPEYTLVLLKKYNYLASVNNKHVPLDRELPAYWDYGMYPAFMDYGSFPISDRWHPGTYDPFEPAIETFLLDLFVDKPALFLSRSDLLFSSGMDAFNPVADLMNEVEGGVEWLSLGDIFRRLHLERVNDDGSVDVWIYANHAIYTNDAEEEMTYHLYKEETQNVPISLLTVNGRESPYRFDGDFLVMDLRIPPGETVEVLIHYEN